MSDEKAAFLGSTSKTTTMADGSLRIQIDLPPVDAVAAFTAFGTPGSPVALARISNAAAVEADRPKAVEKPWGQQAKALYQSSFFRTPATWESVGTNDEYLEWVKHQPSAYSGDYSEWHDDGSKYCVPAHVRRVEHGSGTGYKPPYSAIPLTDEEHKRCHQHGDSVLGDEEWWSRMRIKYVHAWCWERAKDLIQEQFPDIDCSSWGCIPPRIVQTWATGFRLEQYLPGAYKNNEGQTGGEA